MALRTLPGTINCRNLSPLALHVGTRPAAATPMLPEAPCSVNGFFEVEGYGRLQATGRGITPQDAAQNLADTMAATREALAPPAAEPKTREAQVAELLACWLGKAVARKDFGLVERLSKGAALVLAGMVELGNRPGVLAVRSASSPETWYEVEGRTCTCQDYACHVRKGEPEYACKHITAAAMWQRLS